MLCTVGENSQKFFGVTVWFSFNFWLLCVLRNTTLWPYFSWPHLQWHGPVWDHTVNKQFKEPGVRSDVGCLWDLWTFRFQYGSSDGGARVIFKWQAVNFTLSASCPTRSLTRPSHVSSLLASHCSCRASLISAVSCSFCSQLVNCSIGNAHEP